jgi:hypothetical protein
MEGKPASSYQVACRKAARELASQDLQEVSRRCGATLEGDRLVLPFFGRRVELRLAGVGSEEDVQFDTAELPLAEKILILHYLGTTGSHSGRNEMVSFKQLPGASFYEPTYRKRGPERIARRFGADPELFRQACLGLGWAAAQLGDASCSLQIFPRLQAMVVLHRGDEEFPPEVNLLFSDTIANHLPLEDVAVLAGLIASRMIKAV